MGLKEGGRVLADARPVTAHRSIVQLANATKSLDPAPNAEALRRQIATLQVQRQLVHAEGGDEIERRINDRILALEEPLAPALLEHYRRAADTDHAVGTLLQLFGADLSEAEHCAIRWVSPAAANPDAEAALRESWLRRRGAVTSIASGGAKADKWARWGPPGAVGLASYWGVLGLASGPLGMAAFTVGEELTAHLRAQRSDLAPNFGLNRLGPLQRWWSGAKLPAHDDHDLVRLLQRVQEGAGGENRESQKREAELIHTLLQIRGAAVPTSAMEDRVQSVFLAYADALASGTSIGAARAAVLSSVDAAGLAALPNAILHPGPPTDEEMAPLLRSVCQDFVVAFRPALAQLAQHWTGRTTALSPPEIGALRLVAGPPCAESVLALEPLLAGGIAAWTDIWPDEDWSALDVRSPTAVLQFFQGRIDLHLDEVGASAARTRNIKRGVTAAAALAALGGPVGAAVGATVYLFGKILAERADRSATCRWPPALPFGPTG
jgi:hypothetical protein